MLSKNQRKETSNVETLIQGLRKVMAPITAGKIYIDRTYYVKLGAGIWGKVELCCYDCEGCNADLNVSVITQSAGTIDKMAVELTRGKPLGEDLSAAAKTVHDYLSIFAASGHNVLPVIPAD